MNEVTEFIHQIRITEVVQIGNVVYYFVNGLVVGYATVKELGNTTQTMVSVEE